ncbi:M20/M25/M40 family metallo-hydrolase [Deinococcus rubellus]|uniref:M20/M25/M40 family metallo-hydrolase n=1 Tax=Deinococcus rubellus TaxID=1889240 RepID=A0ABY5YDH1_9DEIO|nr:M20/M25/M40 family metallo-hydrolase [Deinococcus rubellus]UWX63063.1 M20/M25/M40 family metallo-hydrolase [Deinococcus rubellus]
MRTGQLEHPELEQVARDWTLKLVGHSSVTNSAGEAAFGPWLCAELQAQPAFAGQSPQTQPPQTRPHQIQPPVWLEPTLHDSAARASVCALARGKGPRTVLLTGHDDVVGVADYGDLAPHAFSPETLAARVATSFSPEHDGPVLADLASGDFVFGRGSLDMKSGLAAGLAVLEAWAASGNEGNVLFVAVPDEEENSHGMRLLVRQLPDIERRYGLEIVAAINLDAEVDPAGDGRGQAVFLGSVGKVLPSLLLLGRPAHAGTPFGGLSAALMLAEMIRRVELHPDFIDRHPAESGPPAALLQLSDLKDHYDVTTPDALWCGFNVLLHGRTPGDVLERLHTAVQTGMEAALTDLETRARASGSQVRAAPVQVLTYAQVLALAEARGGQAALGRLSALAAASAARDTPHLCQQLTLTAAREAQLTGPAAILGFGSLPYPVAELGQDESSLALRTAVERAIVQVKAKFGVSVRTRPFFPGVSDMSFLGGAPTPRPGPAA